MSKSALKIKKSINSVTAMSVDQLVSTLTAIVASLGEESSRCFAELVRRARNDSLSGPWTRNFIARLRTFVDEAVTHHHAAPDATGSAQSVIHVVPKQPTTTETKHDRPIFSTAELDELRLQ